MFKKSGLKSDITVNYYTKSQYGYGICMPTIKTPCKKNLDWHPFPVPVAFRAPIDQNV